jgi:predicted RNase H-like HicB family nuclease
MPLDLRYSLVVEPSSEPDFFCAYSPDLLGYYSTGSTPQEAVKNALEELDEYLDALRELGSPVPAPNPFATIHWQSADLEQEWGIPASSADPLTWSPSITTRPLEPKGETDAVCKLLTAA